MPCPWYTARGSLVSKGTNSECTATEIAQLRQLSQAGRSAAKEHLRCVRACLARPQAPCRPSPAALGLPNSPKPAWIPKGMGQKPHPGRDTLRWR